MAIGSPVSRQAQITDYFKPPPNVDAVTHTSSANASGAAQIEKSSGTNVSATPKPPAIAAASETDPTKASTQAEALNEAGKTGTSQVLSGNNQRVDALVRRFIQQCRTKNSASQATPQGNGQQHASTGNSAEPASPQPYTSKGYPAGPVNGPQHDPTDTTAKPESPTQHLSIGYPQPLVLGLPVNQSGHAQEHAAQASPGPEKKMSSAIRKAFPKIAIIGGSMIAGFVAGHMIGGLASVFLGPLLGSMLGIGAGVAITTKLMQFASAHITEAEENVDQAMSSLAEGTPHVAPHVFAPLGYSAGGHPAAGDYGPKPAGYPPA